MRTFTLIITMHKFIAIHVLLTHRCQQNSHQLISLHAKFCLLNVIEDVGLSFKQIRTTYTYKELGAQKHLTLV